MDTFVTVLIWVLFGLGVLAIIRVYFCTSEWNRGDRYWERDGPEAPRGSYIALPLLFFAAAIVAKVLF